jgi:hypothetical protein
MASFPGKCPCGRGLFIAGSWGDPPVAVVHCRGCGTYREFCSCEPLPGGTVAAWRAASALVIAWAVMSRGCPSCRAALASLSADDEQMERLLLKVVFAVTARTALAR